MLILFVVGICIALIIPFKFNVEQTVIEFGEDPSHMYWAVPYNGEEVFIPKNGITFTITQAWAEFRDGHLIDDIIIALEVEEDGMIEWI